jgi:tetratricopeptide (TPR) repeat protein
VRAASIALLLCCGAASAEAQTSEPTETEIDAEAREHFEAGRAAFDAGRYAEAARSFERAHALRPYPELVYNLAVALDRLRRDADALERFREYLAVDPRSVHRSAVEARIAALEEAVAADERARIELEESGPPWWLWVVLGGVALVAGAAIGIVLWSSGEDVQQSPAVPGDDGVLIHALTAP